MNQLENYFFSNKNNAINKWHHYFEIYDLWMNKYRGKPICLLEIGVYQGGSLKMWREYFGQQAKIYAIDINPDCKQFESENTKIFIGSQDDPEFLQEVKSKIPEIDILIDDGGHTMEQQIIAFEELYDHIKFGGLYLCEDLHTSYWKLYGGGLKNPNSFIEFSKSLIDSLHAWHSEEMHIDRYTRSTYSLHYYDSIIVLEKKEIKKPKSEITGNIIIPIENFPPPKLEATRILTGVNFLFHIKRKLRSILPRR